MQDQALRAQQLGAQDGLVEAELAVELLGDLGRGGHVDDDVEALGLLLDVVGETALAPDVDLVDRAPAAGDVNRIYMNANLML